MAVSVNNEVNSLYVVIKFIRSSALTFVGNSKVSKNNNNVSLALSLTGINNCLCYLPEVIVVQELNTLNKTGVNLCLGFRSFKTNKQNAVTKA